jgi:hypothetical protein
VAIQGRSFPNVPIIKRAHLADTFTKGTVPVVIAAPNPAYGAVVVIRRAHLVDTFTAPAPVNVIAAARGGYPASVYLSRSSLADVIVVPAALPPSTFVYQPRSPLPFPAVVIVGRAHLVDNFILGTQPDVVAAARPGFPAQVITARAHLLDTFTAPAPATIIAAARPGYGATVITSRSSLDDVVTTPAAVPPATFVYQPASPPPNPAQTTIARAHLVDTYTAPVAPIVIAAPRGGYPASVDTSRSSLVDATPDALPPSTFVYQPTGWPPRNATVITARAHLVDTFARGTAPLVVQPQPAHPSARRATVTFCRNPQPFVPVVYPTLISPLGTASTTATTRTTSTTATTITASTTATTRTERT